jgi:hypothetical protein
MHLPRDVRSAYAPGTLLPSKILDGIASQVMQFESMKSDGWKHSYAVTRQRLYVISRRECMEAVGGTHRDELVVGTKLPIVIAPGQIPDVPDESEVPIDLIQLTEAMSMYSVEDARRSAAVQYVQVQADHYRLTRNIQSKTSGVVQTFRSSSGLSSRKSTSTRVNYADVCSARVYFRSEYSLDDQHPSLHAPDLGRSCAQCSADSQPGSSSFVPLCPLWFAPPCLASPARPVLHLGGHSAFFPRQVGHQLQVEVDRVSGG